MTVGELMERLSDLPEDAEVRVAEQPAYPMEYRVGDPVLVQELLVAGPVVYLPEAGHVGYLSGAVAVELGWR